MKRILLRALLFLATTLLVVWICDYLSVRFKFPNKQPFGTVSVRTYYAVPQKDGKTQFLFDPPQAQDCVHSLFPHAGAEPCWYLSSHKQRRIDM
ncbi:MAG TPA: hypothetical protein VH325_03615 [Bryobacteraceae bacterium]|jgi:hypothetical protein|nr:hypothetical protein [Bryobacteraceae bacterium]